MSDTLCSLRCSRDEHDSSHAKWHRPLIPPKPHRPNAADSRNVNFPRFWFCFDTALSPAFAIVVRSLSDVWVVHRCVARVHKIPYVLFVVVFFRFSMVPLRCLVALLYGAIIIIVITAAQAFSSYYFLLSSLLFLLLLRASTECADFKYHHISITCLIAKILLLSLFLFFFFDSERRLCSFLLKLQTQLQHFVYQEIQQHNGRPQQRHRKDTIKKTQWTLNTQSIFLFSRSDFVVVVFFCTTIPFVVVGTGCATGQSKSLIL